MAIIRLLKSCDRESLLALSQYVKTVNDGVNYSWNMLLDKSVISGIKILIQILIKLLIENKLIICALGNLHYKISREKFKSKPG